MPLPSWFAGRIRWPIRARITRFPPNQSKKAIYTEANQVYGGQSPDMISKANKLRIRNRSHPLKKDRQRDDLYGIVAELADDLTDATRCT